MTAVASTAKPMLQARDVCLSFGGVHAISKFSFDIFSGEVLAIIGPNGAGKTSVLNVLTRVFEPSSGSMHFEGHDLTLHKRHEVAALGIARTFQNIELFEAATVMDNLLLGRHRFGQGQWWQQLLRTPGITQLEETNCAAIEDVIEFLDLSPWRNSLVASLPYGVRKVVELGRALATSPKLLFLDEPASGLNPEETRKLAFWIDDIRTDLGITVVMVEHDMSLVSAVADRVICMAQGELLAMGSAAEVQNNSLVVSAYLGA
jgi:branched-chain amino acid transport system ATP-binding protein